MAAENLHSASKPPLSPSPSPVTQNGNPNSALPSIPTREQHQSTRRSPRLQEESDGKYTEEDYDSEEKPKRRSAKKKQPPPPPKKQKTCELSLSNRSKGVRPVSFFIGDPVPDEEARTRWPLRYDDKNSRRKGQNLNNDDDDEDELILNAKCHYYNAEVAKFVFSLGDCAHMKGKEGDQDYVGKILEFFTTVDGEDYFRVQWFFRAEDTVIKDEAACHDKKRIFYSTLENDNRLDCIVSKLKIVQIAPNVNLKSKSIPPCDFYYDMKYSVDYSTFSTMIKDVDTNGAKVNSNEMSTQKPYKPEVALLDIYSGCGGMSTGLGLGAKLSGIDLITKWAVEIDTSACESLKLNHPETQIRNESAEEFLHLLKEWDKLCKKYVGRGKDVNLQESNYRVLKAAEKKDEASSKTNGKVPTGEYEVAYLVDIGYDLPSAKCKPGLKFKVRWLGYGPSEDTWEPIEELSKCQERIRDFVLKGVKRNILPQPGDADVICGGPPCQGISGYNRFRNVESPLDDEKNRQIIVFMDIIDFLRPKYILMENVVDILRFAKGCLGRYALSRLVYMNYQARLGIMAAGCYGLPQFRLRVFLWGAQPQEKLPQFPLPTHDVVLKYGAPTEFERNVVAYDESQSRDLEKALVLADGISDLPPVTNSEVREKMSYKRDPETQFEKYIRASKSDMMGFGNSGTTRTGKPVLYDHRPLPLYEDDYLRVCRIPQKKGATFRDLPGVVVGADNIARRADEPALMPSGKPWVPDYAINLKQGKSRRPFSRLWWDEMVATVLCIPDLHSQQILHPEQDRVLTVRECARLQGFHDYYEFCGTVKDRYCQVGNAVAIPVGRALGYALGTAMHELSGEDEYLMTLPPKFSHSTTKQLQASFSKSTELLINHILDSPVGYAL